MALATSITNYPLADELTPERYARQLLHSLNIDLPVASDTRPASLLWAESGAMWLTGFADHPPKPCPAPLAACAQGAWLALAAMSGSRLQTGFNAHQLLGERAAIAGHSRHGRVSAGGACEIYAAGDGYFALNLARADDHELLPAWLEGDYSAQRINTRLRQETVSHWVDRARLMGLACAPVSPPEPCENWLLRARFAQATALNNRQPLVVDLSGLWAGPLCGWLLSQLGARVIKVESQSRPDGARNGPQAFYHLMNGGKESLALDFGSRQGRRQLLRLLAQADIVIESSRPRGLQQLGVNASELIADHPGKVWLSITGYGRQAPQADWIAYGDDAGVAAGLSALLADDQGPIFCGDAIADPLTGLHGALAAYASWQQGGGELLDMALSRVISYCIGAGHARVDVDYPAAMPTARTAQREAIALGANNHTIIREFGL